MPTLVELIPLGNLAYPFQVLLFIMFDGVALLLTARMCGIGVEDRYLSVPGFVIGRHRPFGYRRST